MDGQKDSDSLAGMVRAGVWKATCTVRRSVDAELAHVL